MSPRSQNPPPRAAKHDELRINSRVRAEATWSATASAHPLAKSPGPAIECRGLSKRFRVRRGLVEAIRRPRAVSWVQSLEDVSFTVAQGEFFGILGPNGAGKTTLFKLIAGLVTADRGVASINGFDVAREPRRARASMSVVFANDRALNTRLTGRQNLRLHAALQQLAPAIEEQRISDVLEMVSLSEAADRMYGTYSSGMKQRLSLARALMAEPEVLLLDEPTRSLDPISARGIRRFLREELCGRLKRTVLLATHDTEEALELCDRVAVLSRGRVLETGSARSLVEKYADPVYRVWTTAPLHPLFAELNAIPNEGLSEESWLVVDVPLEPAMRVAAATLDRLISAGVTVARFERVPLTLGELLERVMHAQERQT